MLAPSPLIVILRSVGAVLVGYLVFAAAIGGYAAGWHAKVEGQLSHNF